jgi:hypothetical protein
VATLVVAKWENELDMNKLEKVMYNAEEPDAVNEPAV